MGPHTGHAHPHAGHPHTAHPHSTLAAAAPFYAQNVAMMSSWRAYDGAGFQRASPYGTFLSLFLFNYNIHCTFSRFFVYLIFFRSTFINIIYYALIYSI